MGQSLHDANTNTSSLTLDFLQGSRGDNQRGLGLGDGDVAPSPVLTLPTFQTLCKFYSLSDPQSLHLENGNDSVPTSQVVGQIKPK